MNHARLWKAIGTMSDVVAGVGLGVSVILAFIGVVTRYVLEIPTWWTFPIQHYSFLFVVYFGAVIASRKGLHVRIEAVEEFLQHRGRLRDQLRLRTSTLLVAFGGSCLFSYFAYDFMVWAWAQPQYDVVLKWFPLGVAKSLPFVAGVFFVLYFGASLIEHAGRLVRARRDSQGEDNQ